MDFFICPGAQKAGTTKLYDLLKLHPEIGLSSQKESKYFLKPFEEISKDGFLQMFDEKESKIIGEIDPEYAYIKGTAKKIKDTLGKKVKIIFMLRNPIDRAYSHYWMSYRRGFEDLSFEKAITEEKDRLSSNSKHALWHLSYIDRGYYSNQIKAYIEEFGIEQIHFVLFEEFIKNPQDQLNLIFDFLGLNTFAYSENQLHQKSNEGNVPKSEFLRKLHGQPSKLKTILKFLIPSKKIRWAFYPIIEKLNKSDKKYSKLDLKTKENLLMNYYSQELEVLSKILSKDMNDFWLSK